MSHAYERDGARIYRRSLAIILREAELSAFPREQKRIVVRMIHAVGQIDLARHAAFTPSFVPDARRALQAGAPVLCDTRMVKEGLSHAPLPAANPVLCTLHDPQVPALARQLGTTHTAAALELWRPHLAGAVVAIGNAPTALFHLLDMLRQPGCPRPAAIVGCPLGFVGAAESKQALMQHPPVPAMTVHGRLGGSAVTAAAINALARHVR